jgi:putative endonuclease
MAYLYILRSGATGRFYIGTASDVDTRLAEHNAGKNRSTKAYKPWRVEHVESFDTLSAARRRERYLKSLKSRAYLEKVILGD